MRKYAFKVCSIRAYTRCMEPDLVQMLWGAVRRRGGTPRSTFGSSRCSFLRYLSTLVVLGAQLGRSGFWCTDLLGVAKRSFPQKEPCLLICLARKRELRRLFVCSFEPWISHSGLDITGLDITGVDSLKVA